MILLASLGDVDGLSGFVLGGAGESQRNQSNCYHQRRNNVATERGGAWLFFTILLPGPAGNEEKAAPNNWDDGHLSPEKGEINRPPIRSRKYQVMTSVPIVPASCLLIIRCEQEGD